MRTTSFNNARKTAIAFALTCCFAAAGAQAQTGVLTQDTVEEGWSSAMAAFQKGEQYANAVAQLNQMLSSIKGLTSGMSLLPNTLQPMDPAPLVQAQCSGSSNSIVGNLLNNVTSLLNQSAMQSQQQICAQIINTQVSKYNSTLQILSQISSSGSQFTSQVEATANSISTLADSGRAQTMQQDYSNALTTEMNNWQTQMKADDEIISSLQAMQSTLAQSVMNAKPDLAGDAVEATALTAAFNYQPSL